MNEWSGIFSIVLQLPPHRDFVWPRHDLPHPKEVGMKERVGEPQGQLEDYGWTLPDGRAIHIRVYSSEYRIHWDMFDPAVDLINHLRHDAPQWWVLLTTTVGGIIGYAASENKASGVVVGILCGFIVGIVTLP